MVGCHHKTGDSVFGTVSRLRVARSGVRIPAGTRDFSCFQLSRPVLGLIGCRDSSLGLKRPEREFNH